MFWRVLYVAGNIISSDDCDWEELPVDGVLWVELEGRRVSGHDHYWIEDGSIETADHHDYDQGDAWRIADLLDVNLPQDRHVLNGQMVSDEEWERAINE